MELEQFKSDIISARQNLFGFALKMLQNKEDAEDVVQETLLRLWNIRRQLDSVSNAAAFAMQTVKNICIDRIRTNRQTTEISDFHLGMNKETPYSQTETKDLIDIVKTIIERLPELQKITIKMRDIDGYEIEKIAEITGTQISAVRMNLSRARKKVKECFTQIIKS
ncbi:MAG: sigma-70 family RNA polymerase sigma factor [Prevotellaceae bacterium]|jgi:RNA polymerase sigma-70 factor (ECF subfamily)|nr:sigma-70 family RNA polymerase sigma factor [Prevotellaceae bacterium]